MPIKVLSLVTEGIPASDLKPGRLYESLAEEDSYVCIGVRSEYHFNIMPSQEIKDRDGLYITIPADAINPRNRVVAITTDGYQVMAGDTTKFREINAELKITGVLS